MSAAGHTDDGDGPLGRIIWRVVDAADYWLTQGEVGPRRRGARSRAADSG